MGANALKYYKYDTTLTKQNKGAHKLFAFHGRAVNPSKLSRFKETSYLNRLPVFLHNSTVAPPDQASLSTSACAQSPLTPPQGPIHDTQLHAQREDPTPNTKPRRNQQQTRLTAKQNRPRARKKRNPHTASKDVLRIISNEYKRYSIYMLDQKKNAYPLSRLG